MEGGHRRCVVLDPEGGHSRRASIDLEGGPSCVTEVDRVGGRHRCTAVDWTPVRWHWHKEVEQEGRARGRDFLTKRGRRERNKETEELQRPGEEKKKCGSNPNLFIYRLKSLGRSGLNGLVVFLWRIAVG